MPLGKLIQMITGAQGGMKLEYLRVWYGVNQSENLGCMEGTQRGSRGDAELEWHFGGDKDGQRHAWSRAKRQQIGKSGTEHHIEECRAAQSDQDSSINSLEGNSNHLTNVDLLTQSSM